MDKAINLKDTFEPKTKNTGWKCPTCNAVYSPQVKKCENCSVNEGKNSESQVFLQD